MIAKLPARTTRAAAAAATLTLAASAMALADTRRISDPRDRSQKVDPVAAEHAHHESLDGVLTHTVEAAEPISAGEFLGMNLRIWLPDGDVAPDREVHVGENPDGSLYALVSDSKGRTRGYGNAWMPNRRTIRVDLAEMTLARKLASYRWRALVTFECSSSEGQCTAQRDRIPDSGRIRHDV
ncbi:MAG: hypothetical protein M3279_12260 [Actinomycetota bacterium]|nr:hypothetical protein [Actinomycetota bacterium]